MEAVTGGLIQMNAKMLVPEEAKVFMCVGIVFCVGFLLVAAFCVRQRQKLYAIVFSVLALVGLTMFIHGVTVPREKIIHACADGPVSLEMVAARYDILEVDGKELVLRVR